MIKILSNIFKMLVELLELILLNASTNTIKSFALLNSYFYHLIKKPTWWIQKCEHDHLYIINGVRAIKHCHDPSHQHYPESNKNHYTIKQWINEYNQIMDAN